MHAKSMHVMGLMNPCRLCLNRKGRVMLKPKKGRVMLKPQKGRVMLGASEKQGYALASERRI